MIELKKEIGIHVPLHSKYEDAIVRVTAALKEEGFGILTQIDVQATFKQKLNKDFQRYVILGACNPPLAYRAFSTDLDVGLLLPCNVVVYETGPEESMVALVDPLSMLGVMTNPGLEPIAQDARERLERAAQALRG